MKEIAVKKNADKWKKIFEMINEVTENSNLDFDDLKEVFSIGYELFKHKQGVFKNASDIIQKYKSKDK